MFKLIRSHYGPSLLTVEEKGMRMQLSVLPEHSICTAPQLIDGDLTVVVVLTASSSCGKY